MSRRLVLFGVLLGAACFAACGGGTPGTDHDLSGIVTDAATGNPISGAMVTFSSDTLHTYDMTTGGDGVYRFLVDVDVPFGQVSAVKDGYMTTSATVYFDTNIRRVDLPMRSTAMMMMTP